MTIRLASFLGSLVPLARSLHQQAASLCLAALDCQLVTETGQMTWMKGVALQLWFKLSQIIQSEDDARCYIPCADRIYRLVYQEDHADMHPLWEFFWSLNGSKYPNFALDHLPQFLAEIIDQKKTLLALVVPVSISRVAH